MSKNRQLIMKISFCSIMSALSLVFSLFVSIRIGTSIKISLHPLPLIIIGIVFGKWYGLLSGTIVGLLDQLLGVYGVSATSPFWMLAFMAWGFFSGLFKSIFNKKYVIGVILTVVFTSVCVNVLNTFAMFMDGLIIKDSMFTITYIVSKLPMRLLLLFIEDIIFIIILILIKNLVDIIKKY